MRPRLFAFLMIFTVLLPLGADRALGLVIVNDPAMTTIAPPQPRHPHWPTPRPHRFAPLEVLSHQVAVNIRNQVAVTQVTEVIYNQTPNRVEGTFLLPLAPGAEVDRFTMTINGQPVAAELLDADKARQVYEDIVRNMRDPALMEYVGRDLLKVRIFPIEPNEKKTLTLKLTQLLKRDSDMVSYIYPLNTAKYGAKPIRNISMKVSIDSDETIKNVYCPSHEIDVRREGPHRAVAGFELADSLNDADFQLVYSLQKQDQRIGLATATYHDPLDGEDDGYFMLLIAPGAMGDPAKVINKDIVFVFDTSGSMAGDKLKQAQQALRFCVANLNKGDRFEIVRFSTEAEALFGRLTEATELQRDQADEFIDGFKPVGGTAIDEALALAIETLNKNEDAKRPRMVIFLTDGRATIGESNEDRIVAHVAKQISERNIRVFSFGVGHDVNTHLIDKITEKTGAVSQYVLPSEDIEIKVSNFYTKIAQPVLSHVELRVHGDVKLSKMYPRPLPDLFKGDQLVVLGRYQGAGEATITLQGAVDGETEVFERSVKFSSALDNDSGRHYAARLWAARRIGHLLDEINLHGEKAELKNEVVRLARAHGVVTPYTAYLIVEDEQQRGVPLARQSLQRFSGDDLAQEALGDAWFRANNEKDGVGGLARARSNLALKSANTIPQASSASGEARYDHAVAGRIPVQQAQRRGGKMFYQNGNMWMDGDVQARPNAKVVRIEFAGEKYFELLAKYPQAANWLSVGSRVQLVLDDVVYEIVDES